MTYHCKFCGSTHDSRFLAELCEENDILNETIRHLVYSFGACTTTAEVNDLVNDNAELLNKHPRLYIHARNSRRRINKMRRAKMDLTETIFKN